MYLNNKNSDNTELCLDIARDAAIAREIQDILVASTSGKTGLIGTREVIAVAGTGHSADTVCVIKPASSNNFFKMRIIEILAKPRV